MTVFVDVDRCHSLKAENKVTKSSAKNNTNAEISIVGHENQHE